MAQIGQPVNYMSGPEYATWLKQTYDQYGLLLKSLNIDTK
jgi:hypothetical protein